MADVIVYSKGGDIYWGRHPDRSIKEWKEFGKRHGIKARFIYSGYHYYDNKTYGVIVFDNKKWDRKELQKRRNNGLLGIRRFKYTLSTKKRVKVKGYKKTVKNKRKMVYYSQIVPLSDHLARYKGKAYVTKENLSSAPELVTLQEETLG